jgi:AcrR family transcriptional regulator
MSRRSSSAAVKDGSGARVAWGTISREQIVQAALRALRQPGGYETMSIRGLAAEMGVSPMALYRHVRDKDDLLDEVVDRLLVRAWRPRTSREQWKDWVVEAADKLRRFLVTQPAALHVYLQHPVVSRTAILRMNAVLDVLHGALRDEECARRAYAAIHTYTVGFAALEASRDSWSSSLTAAQSTDPNLPIEDRETRQIAEQLWAYTSPHQFNEGLRYLIDGIVHHASG